MNKVELDGSIIVVKRARCKEAETPPPSYLDKLATLRTRDELGDSEVVCDGVVPTARVVGMTVTVQSGCVVNGMVQDT